VPRLVSPCDSHSLNQFTLIEHRNRRPDVLVFVNGIPLGLLELKKTGDEDATMRGAWNQVQTYRTDIPSVFTSNAVTVISDGLNRRDERILRRLRALRPLEDDRRQRGCLESRRLFDEESSVSYSHSTSRPGDRGSCRTGVLCGSRAG
jgi:hypothetical protein